MNFTIINDNWLRVRDYCTWNMNLNIILTIQYLYLTFSDMSDRNRYIVKSA